MIWLRRNILDIFNIVKFVGVLLLALMFIHFNTTLAWQSQETQRIADNTNRVVKSQDDILQAIKRATEDSKLTSEQKLDITICMLKVPVSQRTTDVEHNCRNQSTVPASSSSKTSTPVTSTPVNTAPAHESVSSPNQPPSLLTVPCINVGIVEVC